MRDEISLLQAQLTYKKRLEGMLSELRSQQAILKEKVYRLEKSMQSELQDVQRLEKHGLSAFFYYVTGQMEEKLDQERREYYAARVKYDAAVRELNALNQDIDCTVEDLQDLSDCENRYIQVMEAKRIAIENAGTQVSEELLEQEQNLSFLRSQERELEEAIAAGTAALRTANDVVQSLRHVETMDVFDLLGRSLADMAKHETLDDAQLNVELLQQHLQKFNKELSDVQLREGLQVRMDRLLRFSDVFFDQVLTDTAMQKNLKQAHVQVDQTRDNILGILRQLQTRLEEVRHRIERVRVTVDSLIVSIQL